MDELDVDIVELGDAKEVTQGQVGGFNQELADELPRVWN
ncbi:rubrivinodin family lasso peptide [Piscinibacter sakaiensis]|uniref:Uncharacterized protein n=1 Tax=Piscinibacter sakaiensis TaxID=1547922 RepID=A0A0K8NV80_PISS1|nr:rubrivinodin family lasso peptide [Piscinibacter sakaiensis]GAP34302.1 hypothetical protein ISF6_4477 [Piscinibacter sakaiensis]